jgi:hypothetical protein
MIFVKVCHSFGPIERQVNRANFEQNNKTSFRMVLLRVSHSGADIAAAVIWRSRWIICLDCPKFQGDVETIWGLLGTFV